MIIESEDLIALKDVPAFLKNRDGRGPSIATIYRWISSGLRGVKLEVIYRAGRPYSSAEALRRFDEGVTIAKKTPLNPPMAESASHAEKAHESAKRKLAKK